MEALVAAYWEISAFLASNTKKFQNALSLCRLASPSRSVVIMQLLAATQQETNSIKPNKCSR